MQYAGQWSYNHNCFSLESEKVSNMSHLGGDILLNEIEIGKIFLSTLLLFGSSLILQ